MRHLNSIHCRHRCGFGGLVASTWLMVLAIGFAPVGASAQSVAGLGSLFRPQAVPAGGAGADGAADRDHVSGLRVLLSGAARPLAAIDGNIVRVGDTVGGMRVTRIDRRGVVMVSEDGNIERLSVSPSVVKRQRVVAGDSKIGVDR